MPISAEFTWSQTEGAIDIQVSLKGTPARKVHVYISDVFVKVNFSPYLLQLDLNKPVAFEHSVARFDQRDGKLHLTIPKVVEGQSGPWKSLVYTFPTTASAAEKRKLRQERRAASMKRKELHDEKVDELVAETRHKNEKMTLRRQMAVEEDERQHIEELKTEEKEEAERSVYEQFSKMQQDQATQREKQKEKLQKKNLKSKSNTAAAAVAVDVVKTTHLQATPPPSTTPTSLAPPTAIPPTTTNSASNSSIWSDDEEEDVKQEDDETMVMVETNDIEEEGGGEEEEEEEEEEIVFVPDPRENSTVKIEFTERFFPTPARESKLQEENDWLAKNGAHVGKRWGQKREKGKGDSDARDISERDPMWLKGKGDDFYRARDFQSAANAYTAAIAVDEDEPLIPALSNRAACYLRLGKYHLCRADCTKVIECLPPVPKSAASGQMNPRELRLAELGTRSKILVRRGAASCELGEYSSAVVDYEEAISILLLDQEAVTGGPAGTQLTEEALNHAKEQIRALHIDLKKIRDLVECSNLKESGDIALRRKDIEQAIVSYTKCINLDKSFVSALSNRSAAYLVQGQWDLAIKDCTAALQYLHGGSNSSEKSDPAQLGAVPRGGSARHASFTAKTLARRATALSKTGSFKQAVEDLQAALHLDEGNVKLTKDLENMQLMMKENESK
jgi:dyslexia susceptibility 1 candidate gene 1 protein